MMGGLIPWGRKKAEDAKPTTAIAISNGGGQMVEADKGDIVIHNSKSTAIAPRGGGAPLVQVRSKAVMIAGERVQVDPYQIIRCIKRVTQNIGEYKGMEDIYAKIVIGALRKARGDLVNILENEFKIHWQIDKTTGESVFYM